MSKRADKKGLVSSRQEFDASLEPRGAWTCVRVPFSAQDVFGSRARVAVRGTINGLPFRSSIFPMGEGGHFMMVNKAMQEGASIGAGDRAHIVMQKDTTPRVLSVPQDFEAALAGDMEAKASFQRMSYSHQKEYVDWIQSAKRAEARSRRIEKALAMLMAGKGLSN